MSRYNYCIVTEAKGGAGCWLGRHWASRARAERAGGAQSEQASVRGRRRACVGAGRHAGGGARAGGRQQARAARACGRWESGRAGQAASARQGVAGARQRRGLGAGRSTWALGLAAGCALGALGLFSICFDSVFS